uniref:Uncharacterized protein n=1 Tax=Romanomermis culicivorax TaxID=13658 RepID=A0A915KT17_ROMCU
MLKKHFVVSSLKRKLPIGDLIIIHFENLPLYNLTVPSAPDDAKIVPYSSSMRNITFIMMNKKLPRRILPLEYATKFSSLLAKASCIFSSAWFRTPHRYKWLIYINYKKDTENTVSSRFAIGLKAQNFSARSAETM